MTDTALQQIDNWLTADEAERDAHWLQLLQRQRDLEDTARTMGTIRFTNRLHKAHDKGRESTAGGAKTLLARAIEPMVAALDAFVEEQKSKRGVKHCAIKWVELVGHDVAAYITAKVILDGITTKRTVRVAANTITEMILDEMRYRRFLALAPGLFNYKMAKFTTSSYAHMARSLDAAMRKVMCDACRSTSKGSCDHLDMNDLAVVPSQAVLIGSKLIDLFALSTGLIQLLEETTARGNLNRRQIRNELYVIATPDTEEWLSKRNDVLSVLHPVTLPMVVPPLPWTQETKGGYRFALRNKFDLVRTYSPNAPTQGHMPLVYRAVNAIQTTPWHINARVLAVVEQLVSMGGGRGGIGAVSQLDEPAKPWDIDTNEDARREWRRAASKVKDENVQRYRAALALDKVLNVARMFRDEEAIFFPYNLDFRGRIYPIVNYLHPQGDDLAKGLLRFAQGKPIGEDGISWLAIHGANALDKIDGQKINKMTLEERVRLIESLSSRIADVAVDPIGNDWWMEAGEPFVFLAFCFEWAGVLKEGASYVCALPVAQDGTCNGLQHFSAMLRDEIGGAAVNLLPQDRPQDVYDRIAQDVLARLEEIAHEDDLAMIWLQSGLVNRSLCKRPTMTFSYGSKPFGFQTQLFDYLRGEDNWGDVRRLFTMERDGKEKEMVVAACGLMSRLIWEALRSQVRAAFEAMLWLQSCARQIVKSGQPVEWIVPGTGFRVLQAYYMDTRKQVKTMIAGKVVQPSVYEHGSEIATHKQANAISPNVVHSLDAAALMLTVNQAMDEGLECFATVHDSYGTLPADMTVLSRATRASFVRLYTSFDVVADLARQFIEQSPDASKIPEAPQPGNLDLGLVHASEYFFC